MTKESLIKKIAKNSIRRHLFVGGVVFLVIFTLMFFSNKGFLQRIELEAEKAELIEDIEEKKRNIRNYQTKIKKLKVDSLEIEKIAREKYGYVKAGETVYVVETEK